MDTFREFFRSKCPQAVRSTCIRAGELLRFAKNRFCSIGIAALAFVSVAGMASGAQASTAQKVQQLSTPVGQLVSGGKLSFEVASIHLAKPGSSSVSGIHIEPGGRLTASFPLLYYIEFAYKILPTHEREDTMLASLPKWARTNSFVIRAEAPGNPTEDQMRLMMQTLLATRFNLKVHFETPSESVFALVLAKPGHLGARIRLHAQGLPCGSKWTMPLDRASPSVPPGELLAICGQIQAFPGPDHAVLLGARDVTLEDMAGYIAAVSHLGRPLINGTGLTGRYDFTLQWTPQRNIPVGSNGDATGQLDFTGFTLPEALRDQFGMKLRSAKAPVSVLVIDHVEPPTAN